MTDVQTGAATLGQRIAERAAEMSKHAPPEVMATLSFELEKLTESRVAARAISVGAVAPDFVLPDARGRATNLSGLLADGPAVVTFYHGGWCPFCDVQLRSYQSVLREIHEVGAELVAISPQKPDFALADVESKRLTFPVLTDARNGVARRYGLVYSLSQPLRELQMRCGSPIPKVNGDESWELPMAGTFVIDRQRMVRLAHADPNYMKRLEPAAILAGLRDLSS
jgi:peroxiredoxin